jgi:spermidine synthase
MPQPHAPRERPPLALLALFVASGCAALIYEIVWLQLLQFTIGSSAVSLAVLLGTFMGGMGLGSLWAPRWISAHHHPLRVYALIEVGLAASGLAVLYGLPALSDAYVTLVGRGAPGFLLRGTVAALCLLPPTMLMGATLPVIARYIAHRSDNAAWLGFFYGGNTAGAVLGCLAAGFYLLRLHDLATATSCAIAINLTAAGIAWLLARHENGAIRKESATGLSPAATPAPDPATQRILLLVVGLSGFCALAAEVVWTRTYALLLGASVYTFSLILAVFLTGLAAGSSAGAALARRWPAARMLSACQLLLIATIFWAAYSVAVRLPFNAPSPASSPWHRLALDLGRCASSLLPAALLWGASFPLALAAIAPGHHAATWVGRTYAANTLGAILGGVGTSLLLVPLLGTQGVQQLLLALCGIAAVLAATRRARIILPLGAACTLLVWCGPQVPGIPWELVAYGRQIAASDYGARPLFVAEGMNSSVAVTETPNGARFFHVSGKTEASSLEKDMRLQRMLGHLPALFHPAPKSVLIVGCGAGVTAGSFLLHPSVKRVVICDIEPLIPQVVASYFRAENHDLIRDPRVEVVIDDARHYIATTHETFDIITSDPIHPWVKGSAVLYSQEYLELCRRRLNPGGLLTQWIPLYESDQTVVRTEIATFLAAFPNGTIWSNDDEGYGYDTVALGQAAPLRLDADALQRRLDQPQFVAVRHALANLGLGSAAELLSTYAGQRTDLTSWIEGTELNRDRNLRLQYLAGLQLDTHAGTDTHQLMLERRTFPADLITGREETLTKLRPLMGPIKR